MKKRRIGRIVLTAALLLSMSSTCYAAEKTVVREYEVTVTDPNFAEYSVEQLGADILAEVPAEIEEEGKKYLAIDADFVLDSKQEPIEKTKTYEGLTEKSVPKSCEFEDAGELTLKDVSYTETKRTAVTGTKTYYGYATKPNVPETKVITATLPDGTSISVNGTLVDLKRVDGGFTKPFTVTAKFIGDADVDSYVLDGVEIPNNPNSPVFAGYEAVILKSLGYTAENYRITDGRWTSDYIEEDGRTVRYAEFTGTQKGTDWIAYYKETLTENSPGYASYSAKAVYSNQVEATKYNLIATVTYEKAAGLSVMEKILIGSAAVVIIAAAIALILSVSRKKNEEKEA